MHELPLTKENRLKIAQVYRHVPHVDVSIDSVVEAQMGRAFVDDRQRPTAYLLDMGVFHYYAGDPATGGAQAMLAALPQYTLFMPSAAGWAAAAQAMYGERFVTIPRYSFSSEKLSMAHLDGLLADSPWRERVQRLDLALATAVYGATDHICHLKDFDSPADFIARGIGYCVMEEEEMAGVAYSSLVASRGIEVSIVVLPDYRRQGMATALAAALLRYCLEHNMDANWDAANPESCKLALKLGYVATGTYDAYYLRA